VRRRVPSIPRPTGRGVGVAGVFLALFVLSLASGTAELVPLTAAVGLPLLVAPVAASVRARRARGDLAVDASVSPPSSVVGGAVTLRIGVTNRSEGVGPALAIEAPGRRWQRRTGEIGDPAGEGPVDTRSVMVPSGLITLPAPGGRTREVFAGAVGSGRRGIFVLPARRSWVLDPFGLFGAAGPVIPAVSAVVYPAAGTGARWTASGDGDGETGAGEPATGGSGGGLGELVGIRPYVAGDRLSLLHWPARARYGAWFVRQFGTEEGEPTRLVLDDRAGVHRQADFEKMVADAHGLIELCWGQGRAVELWTLSGRAATHGAVGPGVEEARVLLAGVLPRAAGGRCVEGGTVITTGTGARSLPESVERIVVGP